VKFRWSIAPPQPLLTDRLAQSLGIPPLLAQCLLNRGLSEPAAISDFLAPRLRQLADPFRLPNMAAAVERLFLARERSEPMVLFGDYDVDGVTSTALLLEVFGALGWNARYYLPNRLDEGYGLGREAVENCVKKFPATLLLAVDCGSTAVASIAWLKERGVDVIVLDHHQISDPAPAAVALVNPQLTPATDAATPGARTFTELCSVGLAFKLAHALVKHGRERGLAREADFDVRRLLDLVALGTIADVVPLTGENRILVSIGLEHLNATRRPGLQALQRVAQSARPLGTQEVGFQLAPRLNAAGRLENAEDALRLLLARDEGEALPLALGLDAQNRERQKIEKHIAQQVIGALEAKFKPDRDFVIVEGQLLWHIGVVGIVASRVVQQFYRPAIIVGGDGEEWRGSGRSIAGFDLAAALRECQDLLVRHGGHAMAAGLTIRSANLEAFRVRLNELARRALKPEHLQAPLLLDAEVGMAQITLDALAQLEQLNPLGQSNPPVHLFARRLRNQRPPQRLGNAKSRRTGVKLWVTDGQATHESIWWGGDLDDPALPKGEFEMAFVPQINRYNGRATVQLKVLDWRAPISA
jgi:single-stranded-DNA-specific exonuclease